MQGDSNQEEERFHSNSTTFILFYNRPFKEEEKILKRIDAWWRLSAREKGRQS